MTYKNRFIYGGVSGANVQADKSKRKYTGGKVNDNQLKRKRPRKDRSTGK